MKAGFEFLNSVRFMKRFFLPSLLLLDVRSGLVMSPGVEPDYDSPAGDSRWADGEPFKELEQSLRHAPRAGGRQLARLWQHGKTVVGTDDSHRRSMRFGKSRLHLFNWEVCQ